MIVIPPIDPEDLADPPVKPPATSIQASGISRAIAGVSGTIPDTEVFALPVVAGTNPMRAEIYVEAAAGAAADTVLIRLWQDGSIPTTTDGIPLKAEAKFSISGYYNIVNAKLVSADGLEHIIHVQFFNS